MGLTDHASRSHRKNRVSFLQELENLREDENMGKKRAVSSIPPYLMCLLDEAIRQLKEARLRLQERR